MAANRSSRCRRWEVQTMSGLRTTWKRWGSTRRSPGSAPVTSHFTLQSTIDKDPPKMQAFVTALWRATQWIKTHSPDEIYEAIEPYVGSTSRSANIIEITALQKVVDYDASIDAAGWARGEKVWFREMTGIKPLTIADVVNPTFVEV